MRFAVLGLFVFANAGISRRADNVEFSSLTTTTDYSTVTNTATTTTRKTKPTPPPKTTYYDPCKEMGLEDKEQCRKESFCRHDKHHRECCTINYEEYMQWHMGDWEDFMCPADKLTNTKNEKYCNEDADGVYCCAKKDVFADNDGFSCTEMNNVDNDKFKEFDAEPHFECKCKDTAAMARTIVKEHKPRDPCKCEPGEDHGEIDWDVIFETEGSFFTTEGSSEVTWETDGSYWEYSSYSSWDEYDINDYYNSDYYNESMYDDYNATQWEMEDWIDWFDITIISDGDSDYETDINFWDWTVGGDDIVWIEDPPEPDVTNHCLDDINGERCCNNNVEIMNEWIQQGAEFECPNTSFEQMIEDGLNAIGDNLMVVIGIVAAVLGTCIICVCVCCCRCCRRKEPSQQSQSVTVNVNK